MAVEALVNDSVALSFTAAECMIRNQGMGGTNEYLFACCLLRSAVDGSRSEIDLTN